MIFKKNPEVIQILKTQYAPNCFPAFFSVRALEAVGGRRGFRRALFPATRPEA